MFPMAIDENNIYKRCNASVKEKKNLIREFCYREEEIHGEKKRKKTVKERDLWEEERPNLVTVTVWDEKK